jgi:formamidopyrimidine-DNA glycosylase
MPELPEVETMRRGVACVAGARILDVRRPSCRLQPILISPDLRQFRRRVKGRTIVTVGRVGKRIVLELDCGDRIVLEPRMTGLVMLADPPNRTHLRLVFELSGGPAERLLFWDQRGLGVARLVSPAEFDRHYGPAKLGPDALEISAEELRGRFAASRRPIKVALLDQRAVAGIGNLYASEILHRAGLHPAMPCNRLSRAQWKRLHAATGEVLQAAVLHQGSTLRDGTYRIARDQPGNYQVCHWVYQRAGQPCLRCRGGEIVRIVQAQRSTFYCPACQRTDGSAGKSKRKLAPS